MAGELRPGKAWKGKTRDSRVGERIKFDKFQVSEMVTSKNKGHRNLFLAGSKGDWECKWFVTFELEPSKAEPRGVLWRTEKMM